MLFRSCRENRRLQNKLRILHEASQHTDNCFITLTYARDKLPPGASLDHADFAGFMKRARHHAPSGVRFYMCGEYGPQTKRPHYHACLFGIDFKVNTTRKKQNRQCLLQLRTTQQTMAARPRNRPRPHT